MRRQPRGGVVRPIRSRPPPGIPAALAAAGFALAVAPWLSTWLVQAPLRARLMSGYDPRARAGLVATSRLRPAPWSLRGLAAAWIVATTWLGRSPPMKPTREEPGPGQESVWDYPRPPRLERTPRHLEVVVAGRLVADTRRAFRVLETSHPPTYYFPPEDVDRALLRQVDGQSWCEWKGRASYFDVVVGDVHRHRMAWCYPRPTPEFEALRDHLAFFPSLADECRVDGEVARPQAGGFYGGWITPDLAGPFKGEEGTRGW